MTLAFKIKLLGSTTPQSVSSLGLRVCLYHLLRMGNVTNDACLYSLPVETSTNAINLPGPYGYPCLAYVLKRYLQSMEHRTLKICANVTHPLLLTRTDPCFAPSGYERLRLMRACTQKVFMLILLIRLPLLRKCLHQDMTCPSAPPFACKHSWG